MTEWKAIVRMDTAAEFRKGGPCLLVTTSSGAQAYAREVDLESDKQNRRKFAHDRALRSPRPGRHRKPNSPNPIVPVLDLTQLEPKPVVASPTIGPGQETPKAKFKEALAQQQQQVKRKWCSCFEFAD